MNANSHVQPSSLAVVISKTIQTRSCGLVKICRITVGVILHVFMNLLASGAEIQVHASDSNAIVMRPYQSSLTWSGGVDKSGMAEGRGRLVIYERKGKEVVASFDGVMSAGKLAGNVSAKYPKSRDRVSYAGEFSNWSENGIGTMTFKDGTQINGRWRNGELVGQVSVADNSHKNSTEIENATAENGISPDADKTDEGRVINFQRRPISKESTTSLPNKARLDYKDYVISVKRDARAGDPDALGKMSLLSKFGEIHGTNEDVFLWAKTSAAKGSPYGLCALGNCYERGLGVVKDQKKARELYNSCKAEFEKLAKNGDAMIQFYRGSCYLSCDGKTEDTRGTVTWLRKAADQGCAFGQHALGTCYADGFGVEKDQEKAVEWFRRAADQGVPNSQYAIGVCYFEGVGVEQDQKKAAEWFRKAAEQGNAIGQYLLGYCYRIGAEGEQDPKKAVEWFRKAADQGESNSQFALGTYYLEGVGVEQDPKRAVEWFRKAADQGHEDASKTLATLASTHATNKKLVSVVTDTPLVVIVGITDNNNGTWSVRFSHIRHLNQTDFLTIKSNTIDGRATCEGVPFKYKPRWSK